MHARKLISGLGIILLVFFSNCKSRQLTEQDIEICLRRTDFAGHNTGLRAALGWHVDYERRVRETTCCALEPRADVIKKRGDLAAFKEELLKRVDILETPGAADAALAPHELRMQLRKNDACYGALTDLYHDLNLAVRPPRR